MLLVLRLTEPPAALDMAKKRAKALKEISRLRMLPVVASPVLRSDWAIHRLPFPLSGRVALYHHRPQGWRAELSVGAAMGVWARRTPIVR